jgi:hypothetical protein
MLVTLTEKNDELNIPAKKLPKRINTKARINPFFGFFKKAHGFFITPNSSFVYLLVFYPKISNPAIS